MGYFSDTGMPVIREAVPGDCDAIARMNAILQKMHADELPALFKADGGWSQADVRQTMEETGTLFGVAEMQGALVGYIYARSAGRPESAFRHAMEMVVIHHLVVLPRYRRMGVGSGLFDYAKSAAERANVQVIIADVWSFNDRARSFFQRCGLSVCNESLSGDFGAPETRRN